MPATGLICVKSSNKMPAPGPHFRKQGTLRCLIKGGPLLRIFLKKSTENPFIMTPLYEIFRKSTPPFIMTPLL